MKKLLLIALITVGLFATAAPKSEARVFVNFGFGFPFYPYPAYYGGCGYNPYYGGGYYSGGYYRGGYYGGGYPYRYASSPYYSGRRIYYYSGRPFYWSHGHRVFVRHR